MRNGDDPFDTIGQMIRYGTIADVDLAAGKATVRMGDIVTQSVRWLHAAAGETASWSPPSPGEQVLLLCPEGDIASAIILRGVHSDAHPPAGDTLRELIRFADGAVLAYDPTTQELEAILPPGATATIVASGGITLDGPVHITGLLQVDGKVHADGDVVAGSISLRQHKHPGVQSGGAITGAPQ